MSHFSQQKWAYIPTHMRSTRNSSESPNLRISIPRSVHLEHDLSFNIVQQRFWSRDEMLPPRTVP